MNNLRELSKSRILNSYINVNNTIQKSEDTEIEKSIKDNSVESLEGIVNKKKEESASKSRTLGLDMFKDSPITAHYIHKATVPIFEVTELHLKTDNTIEKSDEEKKAEENEAENEAEREITKGFIDWKDANGYINPEDVASDLIDMYVIEKSLSDSEKEILVKSII